MQRGPKNALRPSGALRASEVSFKEEAPFPCPALGDGEGPALLGRAAPLACRSYDFDGVGARGKHAGVVAQLASGPAIVKAPLLGPVQVQSYVAL